MSTQPLAVNAPLPGVVGVWQPVHAPLARHAQQRPHDPFLLSAPGLSYAQAANWVAHVAVQHLALHAGERVALWLDKGSAYALSILATLHAGCAYVPLDGSQPVQRTGLILQDARPRVVITDHGHACALFEQGLPDSVRLVLLVSELAPAQATRTDLQVVALGTRLCNAPPTALPGCEGTPRDRLAALLYTSGSTGTPKGVQLSHGNLSNFVRWCVQELELTEADRLLNLASFNFDLSTFDLFATLQAGAALYVSSERETAQVLDVADLLRRQAISVLYTVPSMLALLNRINAWGPLKGSLRCVAFAGEVMAKPQLQVMAAALHPATRFYNLYGPTETNVCLYHRVTPEDVASDGPIPIGVPIAGANVWLVDEHGRMVLEEGVLGEIWAAGRCVTPGYWARQDPVLDGQHARGMHATGDHGEWQRGVLLYRGRKDRMLKISGYRVELGEIEAALARHPQLQEVAVRVEPGDPPRLVAHFATRDPSLRLSALELKAFCAQHLPRYMVPHKVVQHATLPKNANGKTDHRALAQCPAVAPEQVTA